MSFSIHHEAARRTRRMDALNRPRSTLFSSFVLFVTFVVMVPG